MSQQTVRAAVEKMRQGLEQAPTSGRVKNKAHVKWEGDVLCTSKVGNFPALTIDEPPVFGGGNTAQSPADLVLSALGACQLIMYSALASCMGIQLDSLEVDLTGELDLRGLLGLGEKDGIPPGFQNIRFETRLRSPADTERLKELVDTVERQCPILDTMLRSIDVTGKALINGSEYVAQAQRCA